MDNGYQQALMNGMPTIPADGSNMSEELVEVSTGEDRVSNVQLDNGGRATEDAGTDDTDLDDFESDYDFGNISTLEQANGAIASLRKQINLARRENEVLSAKCLSITQAYARERGDKQKNGAAKSLRGHDQANVIKIRKVIHTVIGPNQWILNAGWHLWDDDSRSFCQRFIKLAELEYPEHSCINMFHYWDKHVTVHINSMMLSRRGNLTQTLKKRFQSKEIYKSV